MSKTIKYLLAAVVLLAVLTIVTILLITTFVDVESYKPKIEQLVTEKTGYPLHLGGEISLSLFPWVGLSFANLQLDNPDGFTNKGFVRIEGFQARLKVMPLLSKKVEISKFVVDRPEIILEKNPQGIWNWQKLTHQKIDSSIETADKTEQKVSVGKGSVQSGFALQSLVVGEFAITNGSIDVDDLQNNQKHQISAFNLQLTDVSFDKPIKMVISSQLNGKPLSLKGSVGPLGADPGMGKLDLDVTFAAFGELSLAVSGSLTDLKDKMSYNINLDVEQFSPKKLFTYLDMKFPVTTTDPNALEKLGFQAGIAGTTRDFALSDGKVVLDDTSIDLAISAKDFSRPNLAVDVAIDSIDLDRYLPPTGVEGTRAIGQGKTSASGKKSTAHSGANATINYDPLRKLLLKGIVKLAEIKIHGGYMQNFVLDITGKNGLFTLNSLGMDLYNGNIAATGKLNVQKEVPVTNIDFSLNNVQAGALLKDFIQKEIMEGMVKANISVNMKGDTEELIKKSLNGKGDLLFQDGALIGIDLDQMVKNIKTGFILEQQGESPRTEFAELHAPFTIVNGLVNTPQTSLISPYLEVLASGDANLVSEGLKMKLKPTLYNSKEAVGATGERTSLTVPVLVGGTFESPKFSPDLETLVRDRIPTEKVLGELLKDGKVSSESKEQLEKEVEQAKGLLKGFFGN